VPSVGRGWMNRCAGRLASCVPSDFQRSHRTFGRTGKAPMGVEFQTLILGSTAITSFFLFSNRLNCLGQRARSLRPPAHSAGKPSTRTSNTIQPRSSTLPRVALDDSAAGRIEPPAGASSPFGSRPQRSTNELRAPWSIGRIRGLRSVPPGRVHAGRRGALPTYALSYRRRWSGAQNLEDHRCLVKR
jgi:hypothetical protein